MIGGLITLGIALGAIVSFGIDNPEVLEGFENAAMVRCVIGDMLFKELADAGINQSDRSLLAAIAWGKEMQVSDIRSLNDRIKDKVAKPIMWDAICHSIER